MKCILVALLAVVPLAAQQDRPLTRDELKAQMQANSKQLIQATSDLDQVMLKMQAYMICRQHRHWFQFWKKRCRYE